MFPWERVSFGGVFTAARGFSPVWQVKFWVQNKVIEIASIGEVEIPAAVFTQIVWIASGGGLCCFDKKT